MLLLTSVQTVVDGLPLLHVYIIHPTSLRLSKSQKFYGSPTPAKHNEHVQNKNMDKF